MPKKGHTEERIVAVLRQAELYPQLLDELEKNLSPCALGKTGVFDKLAIRVTARSSFH